MCKNTSSGENVKSTTGTSSILKIWATDTISFNVMI